MADAVSLGEVFRQLCRCTISDQARDGGLVEHAAGLQESTRRLLQQSQRGSQRPQQLGTVDRAAAVALAGQLEQHGQRARGVEIFVHRRFEGCCLRLRPIYGWASWRQRDAIQRGIEAAQTGARVV